MPIFSFIKKLKNKKQQHISKAFIRFKNAAVQKGINKDKSPTSGPKLSSSQVRTDRHRPASEEPLQALGREIPSGPALPAALQKVRSQAALTQCCPLHGHSACGCHCGQAVLRDEGGGTSWEPTRPGPAPAGSTGPEPTDQHRQGPGLQAGGRGASPRFIVNSL